jgi:SPP1 gp7 family putative phage head morphogenesis protein
MGYWENRQAQIMYEQMEDAEKVARELADIYAKATRELNYQIGEIFDRFTDKHNLTEDEARRLLGMMKDPADIATLREALAKDPKNAALLAELESPAYRARIERLENLQNEIDRMMQEIYGQEKSATSEHYANVFHNSYYRNIYEIQRAAGFQFSFSAVDPYMLNQMLAMEWAGGNYSSRIWNNTEALAKELKEQLIMGYLTGKPEADMAAEIANKFAVANYKARRIVRTESNFQSAQAQLFSYEEADIEKYMIVATLDLKTSEICREMDGKIFARKDAKVGVNINPFHPFCRTTNVAVFDDDDLSTLKRRARDPVTGESKLVPADTNYKKWYQQNVANNPKAQAAEKAVKNWSADTKQYEAYKKLIEKKHIGKTLADFQEMKYTKPEFYDMLKTDYRRRNTLRLHPEKALPEMETTNLPEPKFTKYLFGGENPDGLAKGAAFESRLGYNADNWKELQREIKQAAPKYPATIKGSNDYGVNYEQKIVLYGKNGTPANVVVAWFKDIEKNEMRMVSAYIKEV